VNPYAASRSATITGSRAAGRARRMDQGPRGGVSAEHWAAGGLPGGPGAWWAKTGPEPAVRRAMT